MNKPKILKNGDIIGVKCYAYFAGIDGLGKCNNRCQWWLDEYLEVNKGCVMWTKDKGEGKWQDLKNKQ